MTEPAQLETDDAGGATLPDAWVTPAGQAFTLTDRPTGASITLRCFHELREDGTIKAAGWEKIGETLVLPSRRLK